MTKPNGTKPASLSLGELQKDIERATATLKRCRSAAERANAAYADAEEGYGQAQKALLNGVTTLRAQTKMPF